MVMGLSPRFRASNVSQPFGAVTLFSDDSPATIGASKINNESLAMSRGGGTD